MEPIHRAAQRQHTETDLILRGRRTLVMAEIKLGYKDREITGWQQAAKSPIVSTYEAPARSLMVAPENWKVTLSRFAQLYKNLILGQCLAGRWSSEGTPLDLHLLVVVNGATVEALPDGATNTYMGEFQTFCGSCSLDRNRLHAATWQELRRWICNQENADLKFIKQRLQAHPLL